MITPIHYNDFINYILGLTHVAIMDKRFIPDYEIEIGPDKGYPLLVVSPMPFSYDPTTSVILRDVQISILDKLDLERENLQFILSRTEEIMINYIQKIYDDGYDLISQTITPIVVEYDAQLAGHVGVFSFRSFHSIDKCEMPFCS